MLSLVSKHFQDLSLSSFYFLNGMESKHLMFANNIICTHSEQFDFYLNLSFSLHSIEILKLFVIFNVIEIWHKAARNGKWKYGGSDSRRPAPIIPTKDTWTICIRVFYFIPQRLRLDTQEKSKSFYSGFIVMRKTKPPTQNGMKISKLHSNSITITFNGLQITVAKGIRNSSEFYQESCT